MAEQAETREKICGVCGRNLLIGERASPYVSRDGHAVDVCELCKARAESAGWMRPEDVAEGGTPEGQRRRRRGRGELLGGLLGRGERERRRPGRDQQSPAEEGEKPRSEDAEGRGPERTESEQADDRRPARAPAEAEPNLPKAAPGVDLEQALAAFNASESRRTIAGLSRSLGEPQATAIAVRTAGGQPGARLTVAWELAWYQWEIGPGKRGPEIRQTAKGETIDQLRAADRNWNLQMAGDGALSRRRSG